MNTQKLSDAGCVVSAMSDTEILRNMARAREPGELDVVIAGLRDLVLNEQRRGEGQAHEEDVLHVALAVASVL